MEIEVINADGSEGSLEDLSADELGELAGALEEAVEGTEEQD